MNLFLFFFPISAISRPAAHPSPLHPKPHPSSLRPRLPNLAATPPPPPPSARPRRRWGCALLCSGSAAGAVQARGGTAARQRAEMFVLSQIEHNLPMPPHLLSRPLVDAIKAELERLFLDKVVANLGLCVSVYDIRSVEGGFIFPGEGCSTYKVSFRLLMFRPFVGEVLVGKISGYDEKGLHVSLDFFSDISIPGHLMQYGTARALDGRWMLKTEDGDELYLDLDDEIRFLVSSIKYPPIPVEQKETDRAFAPMQIIGSIKGDGLGLLAWWAADEEEGEAEAEAEE
ncbi:uncharacterized protein LOC127779689 isoform X3 [Oryza glaberrima]|uniref:uncharacterized protein LOC127779689 isoform X3 n=1 Tax=Oryza glaberrima TaxID=4538 RepID=UPI00224C4CD7|nr:uncharacterized protein LOC127779689 isoform X3 [Oryza glaberrima]